MGVALHPYILGQPHCLRLLRRALAQIAAPRKDVWFARAGDISAFSHRLPEGTLA